jgi:MFS family permease
MENYPCMMRVPLRYTVGLIVASFIFASLAQTLNEMRLLGYGMLIWAGGVLGTGLSDSFGIMLLCRIMAGCGGGSVMTLTFPFIDDVAPAKNKTLWFGVLGLTQPVGIAVGYIALGQIASASEWPVAFYTEVGACMRDLIEKKVNK